MAPGAILQGFSFFPRGGSAQVVRYLTAALLEDGWNPEIVAGTGQAADNTSADGGAKETEASEA